MKNQSIRFVPARLHGSVWYVIKPQKHVSRNAQIMMLLLDIMKLIK